MSLPLEAKKNPSNLFKPSKSTTTSSTPTECVCPNRNLEREYDITGKAGKAVRGATAAAKKVDSDFKVRERAKNAAERAVRAAQKADQELRVRERATEAAKTAERVSSRVDSRGLNMALLRGGTGGGWRFITPCTVFFCFWGDCSRREVCREVFERGNMVRGMPGWYEAICLSRPSASARRP